MKGLKGLFEILTNLRRHQPKRVLKVCPRCGSPDIHLSSSLDAWLTPEQYICRKCGYKGPIILEVEIDEEKEGREKRKPKI